MLSAFLFVTVSFQFRKAQHITSAFTLKAKTKLIYFILIGSNVIVIPAGMPRKPGMSRDDLFNANASLVYDFACSVACFSPCALVAIITNPVNSMVPVFSEVLMRVRFSKFRFICLVFKAHFDTVEYNRSSVRTNTSH